MANFVRFPLAMRVLHWLMALCIAGLLAAGLYMVEMEREDSLRAGFYALHKSFGVTVLLLVAVRIAVRSRSALPPLPDSISHREKIVAKLGHSALYVLMLLMPLTGYAMSESFGFGVKWFGIELPRLFSADRARAELFGELHELLAYGLLLLIAAHVAAVGKHWWVEKENLLKRMW